MVYLRPVMTLAFRLLFVNVLAVLAAAGLIGCEVFSASVHQAPPVQEMAMPAGMAGHDHHAGHAINAEMPGKGGHQNAGCDGCDNSLLNRASITPQAGLAPVSTPAPVFLLAAAPGIDRQPGPAARQNWPPCHGPPLRPNTLTQQKISLLI